MHDVCRTGLIVVWRQSSHPTVQKQRDKWVVCVECIDTVSGARKPRQLGTYPSRRSAGVAAASLAASSELGVQRDTIAAVVDRWLAGKVDVSN